MINNRHGQSFESKRKIG
jgi:dedicator of cytokinesis protein 1